MIGRKKRIVLYFPLNNDPATGVPSGKDILPNSLLQVAAWPAADGYEVVIVDGNLLGQAEGHRRAVAACADALVYGTTGILGYQVADAALCSAKVAAAYPDLPRVIGGWFASVAPELELATGLYDAVALGQGEITFRELVQALEAGEPLDAVAGLALPRDGGVHYTDQRRVVGWSDVPDTPWHLLDLRAYRAAQAREHHVRRSDRMPAPPGFDGRPFFSLSYFSSYGCPEPCTFCCSPEVTGQRWKAMPAERMLDEIAELQERFGVDAIRFFDANWGVAEKRVRGWCEGILERDMKLWWYPMLQAFSLLRYDPETIDLMKASGGYVLSIGGETGDAGMLATIGKHTAVGDNVRAAVEVDRRGIASWITYIIGYPGETPDSMMNTIDECRRIAASCRLARPTVWPFRPIPGTAMYRQAVEMGYVPPKDVLGWGTVGQFHLDETWQGKIPSEVARARRLFEHYYTLSLGLARGRQGWWERRARRRMESGDFRGAALEAKAFSVYHRLSKPFLGRRETVRPGHRTSVDAVGG